VIGSPLPLAKLSRTVRNIASLDPRSGKLTPLYNPRTQHWNRHFAWHGERIEARTAVGRATAALLRFNDAERITIRAHLLRRGRYPLSL
jgi:hypothetical protein